MTNGKATPQGVATPRERTKTMARIKRTTTPEGVVFIHAEGGVTVQCRNCGRDCSVSCSPEQYKSYIDGAGNIQDIMPDVPAGERELLISGICGLCWDSMFRHDEEGRWRHND